MSEAQCFTIDGVSVELDRGLNVLEHAKRAGVSIPAFCYYPELSIYGACRMCLVEIIDQRTGRASLDSSCSLLPKAGMVIKTNSARLSQYRRNILELLIANHCADCTVCEKSLNCKLQEFAARFGIRTARYPNRSPRPITDSSSPCITKDKSKCICCGACVRFCNGVQTVGAIDFARRGSEMEVSCSGGKPIAESNCTGCSGCSYVCPTGAITIKNDTERVWKLLRGGGVNLMLASGFEPLAEDLHRVGFTNVESAETADNAYTTEESAALLLRLEKGGDRPLFSSDCPAWVSYVQKKHPEVLPYLSKTKPARDRGISSGGAFGIVSHCAAAKSEDGLDFALTLDEVFLMLKQTGTGVAEWKPESVYCGTKTEAVIKEAFKKTGGETPEPIGLKGVPKADPKSGSYSDCIRTAELKLGGKNLRAVSVSTLGAASELIERIKSGERFDYVEVRACPGGCGV